jgi:SAM-dependent methyltransferase
MGLELRVEGSSPLVSPAAQRLVEVTLECARVRAPGELAAAEIGAGCGAVALALAAFEPRFTRIFAVDPSPEALRVAAANGVRYQLNLVVDWRVGDGLGAVPEPVDVIVCDAAALAPSQHAARLFAEAPAKLRPGGALLCALAGGVEEQALASLALALPDARVWAAPASGGAFVAVAQVP